jgi:hypothetical protein
MYSKLSWIFFSSSDSAAAATATVAKAAFVRCAHFWLVSVEKAELKV